MPAVTIFSMLSLDQTQATAIDSSCATNNYVKHYLSFDRPMAQHQMASSCAVNKKLEHYLRRYSA